jgi:hypothetical protein
LEQVNISCIICNKMPPVLIAGGNCRMKKICYPIKT